MTPVKVAVMRHAEKTDNAEDSNLSSGGLRRAQSLVGWFPGILPIDFIFATAPSKHSCRPLQTVQPLADFLALAPDISYADQDYGALAMALLSDHRFDGMSILVCWHHGNIPGLLKALGAAPASFPDPWPSAIFNLVLLVDFQLSPAAVSLVVEPF